MGNSCVLSADISSSVHLVLHLKRKAGLAVWRSSSVQPLVR